MKIREFLKFYIGYNSFQVVNETGDRWTDVLSKEEVLKSFGNAETKAYRNRWRRIPLLVSIVYCR